MFDDVFQYKVQGYLGKHYMDKLVEWTEKYPKMFLTWIGPATVRVILNHPDSVKQILRTAGNEREKERAREAHETEY